MEKFIADKSTIRELLEGVKYRIPSYQRPYSWEKDYIDNFWNYLTDESENYFLGTMVLNNEYLKGDGVKDVVDGQQRFITITILYSVIRDIFQYLGDTKKANAVHSKFIAFQNEDGDDFGYKITVGDSLRAFFEKNIQSNAPRDINEVDIRKISKEEKRVADNYKFFLEEINKELSKQIDLQAKIEFLQLLREKLSGLDIVYIEVSSEDDAYTFFETINATGMKLSTADVLKNLLFKKTSLSKDLIQAKWDEILEKLKNQDNDFDITRFIRHYWLSRHDKISDKRLYHTIKDSIDNQGEYQFSYDIFIDELLSNAELYNLILYPNENELGLIGPSLYRNLKNLRLLGVQQPNPLILSLIRKIKLGPEFKIPELFKLVEKIEHFTFIYNTVVNKSPSKLEKIYSKNAVNIFKAKNSQELRKSIVECDQDLKQYMPKKEEFDVNFKELKYSKENKIALRYLFGKLNTSGKAIQIDFVNIEHIFPQNPSNEFSKEEIDSTLPYVHDLGNLILIEPLINQQAGNYINDHKISKYKSSQLPMTKEIIEYIVTNNGVWNKESIIRRTIRLCDDAWNILSF